MNHSYPSPLSPWLAASIFTAIVLLCGCHSPKQSQNYFSTAAMDDPMLEPIHGTPLYTVYYDHGLRRCVLHSAHTWGESGGGGGGTGVGVAVFKCDPRRLKEHAENIEAQIRSGGRPALPSTSPSANKKKPAPAPRPMAPPSKTPKKKPAPKPEPSPYKPAKSAPPQPTIQ